MIYWSRLNPCVPRCHLAIAAFLDPGSIKPSWVPGRFARTDYSQHPLWDLKSHKRTRIFNIHSGSQSAGKPIGVILEKFGLPVPAAGAGVMERRSVSTAVFCLGCAMARTATPV